jgi:hypothetical protein
VTKHNPSGREAAIRKLVREIARAAAKKDKAAAKGDKPAPAEALARR